MIKPVQRASTLIGIALLGSLFLVACAAPRPVSRQVTLFFYSQSDFQNASFDHPVIVTRTVSGSGDLMDIALRSLFAGPTDAEKNAGARTSKDLTDLGPFYLGVSTQGTAAVVNFRSAALAILNSAAARQMMAKEPIRQTLLQFPGITDVKYEIDGKIFEEWDA